MLRIFMAPQSEPGRLRLQADRETWRTVQQLLLPRDRAAYDELDILLKRQPDGAVVRLTLDDARARLILGLAGLSA